MLAVFIELVPKEKDESRVDLTIMSTAKIDVCVPTVVGCLPGHEKRGNLQQGQYVSTYVKMLKKSNRSACCECYGICKVLKLGRVIEEKNELNS